MFSIPNSTLNKSVLSFIAFFCLSTLAFAQPNISYEKTTHDFGRIEEAEGPVTYEFKFKNEGDAPLVVQGVKASCGCTTPFWTKDPIAPGAEGTIQAKFDPHNRPGGFTKSLTVTSNSEPNISRLFIKGYVEPTPKAPEEEYQKVMGGLRLKSNYLNLGKMTENQDRVSKDFKVYNDSDTVITFQDKHALPKFIEVEIKPKSLKPKELGLITIYYNAKERNDLGLINDMITLLTDEHGTKSMKYLNVTGQIGVYFPDMTPEELAQAPKLQYSKESHDFGNLNQGEKTTYKFSFTNTGKQALNIRKIKTSCGCTASSPEKKEIQPGEQSYVEVTFDSKGRKGKQYKYVTVFSNDPKKPESRLEIRANVVTN